MGKFKVNLREIYLHTVDVEATSSDEAIEIVRTDYLNNPSNFIPERIKLESIGLSLSYTGMEFNEEEE